MEFLEKLNLANKELRKELGKEIKIVGRSYCCGTCTVHKINNKRI